MTMIRKLPPGRCRLCGATRHDSPDCAACERNNPEGCARVERDHAEFIALSEARLKRIAAVNRPWWKLWRFWA